MRTTWSVAATNQTGSIRTLGHAFAATGLQQTGPVGAGTAHLMRQQDVVDFAVKSFGEHRSSCKRDGISHRTQR